MADTCYEVTWLLALLKDLGIGSLTLVPLYCDNKSALYIASNPIFHERTKHIEIDCLLVQEKLVKGVICTSHLPSTQQPYKVSCFRTITLLMFQVEHLHPVPDFQLGGE